MENTEDKTINEEQNEQGDSIIHPEYEEDRSEFKTVCPECEGTGLKDQHTLCENCEGSGKVA